MSFDHIGFGRPDSADPDLDRYDRSAQDGANDPASGEWYPEWDGPGDFRERALDAGYDPSDPKAVSLEQWGAL